MRRRLVLWLALAAVPAAAQDIRIQLCDIDMRDLYFENNVIGTPPKGQTIYVTPAHFETVPETKGSPSTTASARPPSC